VGVLTPNNAIIHQQKRHKETPRVHRSMPDNFVVSTGMAVRTCFVPDVATAPVGDWLRQRKNLCLAIEPQVPEYILNFYEAIIY